MKFNRETLIDRATVKREEYLASIERANVRNQARRDEEVAEHLANRDLRPLINLLRRAQDNGRVLTKEDFKGVPSVSLHSYETAPRITAVMNRGEYKPIVPDTGNYDRFIEFLETVEDEFVTSTALWQHGFKNFQSLI